MIPEFESLDEIELFMDCEKSYEVLKNACYPLALYRETWKVIKTCLNDERKCTNIPPIEVARKLDGTDLKLSVPDSIFHFLEKAYRDGYYQLRDLRCAFELGQLYADERYGHVDYQKAAAWFEKGAKAGDGEAEAKLGKCYYLGLGVPVDYKKAFHCLVKWALIGGRGSAEALYLLGDMYYHGHYVEKDEVQAYELYQRAWNRAYNASGMTAFEVVLRLADYNLNYICTEESCITALEYYQNAERYFYDLPTYRLSVASEGIVRARAGQERARQMIQEKRNKKVS